MIFSANGTDDTLPDPPQHVYTVRFSARELWSTAATARDTVHADLWEDYLERTDRGTHSVRYAATPARRSYRQVRVRLLQSNEHRDEPGLCRLRTQCPTDYGTERARLIDRFHGMSGRA